MEIDVLTLFPTMFSPLFESVVGRAIKAGLVTLRRWNIRDFATDRHRTVDDAPYGGGGGMVLKPEPVFAACEAAKAASPAPVDAVVLLSPQGRLFRQSVAAELAKASRLILICGHYEGFDERIRTQLATEEISIGDFVLTGGELPAMVVIDAVVRLIPGVLGNEDSPRDDSFASGLLEYPQYTRPREFRGEAVPDVLLSGDHEAIRKWRRKESLRRTLLRRPELLEKADLTAEDLKLLQEVKEEE